MDRERKEREASNERERKLLRRDEENVRDTEVERKKERKKEINGE